MIEARKRARDMDPKDERKRMEMQRMAHQSAQHGSGFRVQGLGFRRERDPKDERKQMEM